MCYLNKTIYGTTIDLQRKVDRVIWHKELLPIGLYLDDASIGEETLDYHWTLKAVLDLEMISGLTFNFSIFFFLRETF